MNILSNRTGAGKMITIAAASVAKIMSRIEGGFFGNQAPQCPPIFIIGLPRSGTTLLYQTLCHCFQLAYSPMLTNYLVWMPSLAVWLCKAGQLRYASNFRSRYGVSQGMASPGEGNMWNLWLEKNRYYQGKKDLETSKAAEIIKFVGRTERILKSPFINKNLRNNNRIGLLAELFPTAVFLVALRNPYDTALSLLRARIEIYGDVNRTYAVEPRSYKPCAAAGAEKTVVEQLNGLMRDIYKEMIKIGARRFSVIRYEELCFSPSDVVKKFYNFIAGNGLVLTKRQSPPESFQMIQGQTEGLLDAQIQAVHETLNRDFNWDIYHILDSMKK